MGRFKIEGKEEGKQISLTLTPLIKKRLDELVELGIYPSRSEAVRHAILELIERKFKIILEGFSNALVVEYENIEGKIIQHRIIRRSERK